VFDVNLGKLLL